MDFNSKVRLLELDMKRRLNTITPAERIEYSALVIAHRKAA